MAGHLLHFHNPAPSSVDRGPAPLLPAGTLPIKPRPHTASRGQLQHEDPHAAPPPHEAQGGEGGEGSNAAAPPSTHATAAAPEGRGGEEASGAAALPTGAAASDASERSPQQPGIAAAPTTVERSLQQNKPSSIRHPRADAAAPLNLAGATGLGSQPPCQAAPESAEVQAQGMKHTTSMMVLGNLVTPKSSSVASTVTHRLRQDGERGPASPSSSHFPKRTASGQAATG